MLWISSRENLLKLFPWDLTVTVSVENFECELEVLCVESLGPVLCGCKKLSQVDLAVMVCVHWHQHLLVVVLCEEHRPNIFLYSTSQLFYREKAIFIFVHLHECLLQLGHLLSCHQHVADESHHARLEHGALLESSEIASDVQPNLLADNCSLCLWFNPFVV